MLIHQFCKLWLHSEVCIQSLQFPSDMQQKCLLPTGNCHVTQLPQIYVSKVKKLLVQLFQVFTALQLLSGHLETDTGILEMSVS